jgi:hypothetical protein
MDWNTQVASACQALPTCPVMRRKRTPQLLRDLAFDADSLPITTRKGIGMRYFDQ